MGGRHKPFPLDDEAHPSRPSSACDWNCGDGHRQRHSTAPLGHGTITSPGGTLALGPAEDSGSSLRRRVALSAKQH